MAGFLKVVSGECSTWGWEGREENLHGQIWINCIEHATLRNIKCNLLNALGSSAF